MSFWMADAPSSRDKPVARDGGARDEPVSALWGWWTYRDRGAPTRLPGWRAEQEPHERPEPWAWVEGVARDFFRGQLNGGADARLEEAQLFYPERRRSIGHRSQGRFRLPRPGRAGAEREAEGTAGSCAPTSSMGGTS